MKKNNESCRVDGFRLVFRENNVELLGGEYPLWLAISDNFFPTGVLQSKT